MVNKENVLAEKAAQQEHNMFNSVSTEPVAAGNYIGIICCVFVMHMCLFVVPAWSQRSKYKEIYIVVEFHVNDLELLQTVSMCVCL